MENAENKKKLFFADTNQQIGWVQVYNGVNVIEYTVDKTSYQSDINLLILPIGDCLKEEIFGAFDPRKHVLPYQKLTA
jgi:hypothetical protein